MEIKRLPLGVYAANCYIISDDSKNAAIIDPGGDYEDLKNYIIVKELDVKYIIITHAHADHIGALPNLINDYHADILIHTKDYEALQNSKKNLSFFMGKDKVEVEATRKIEDGEIIDLGSYQMEIIHTPGHTEGSICIKVENNIFTGDTLFASSIGRTDLVGGSYEDIMESLKKLINYSDDINILPGHGPVTTILTEKKNNPFLRNI